MTAHHGCIPNCPHSVNVTFIPHGGVIFAGICVLIVLQVVQFFALLPRTIEMIEDMMEGDE